VARMSILARAFILTMDIESLTAHSILVHRIGFLREWGYPRGWILMVWKQNGVKEVRTECSKSMKGVKYDAPHIILNTC